jgi:gliding motility-associated-like protein
MSKKPLSLFLRFLYTALLFSVSTGGSAFAQYISTCETVPFACPTVCSGGSVTVKIFQVQRLPVGTLVQAQLSDASGNFGAGAQILPIEAYSTNGGSSYTPGPYAFSHDVSDLFARFAIPASTPVGSNYNLRIRASNGFTADDNFRCPNAGHIAVTAGGQTLPPVPQTEQGQGKWIGHVYTWNPTTGAQLTTDALVNAQTFFSPSAYLGHTLYNSRSLDLNFSETGGMPGSTNNGTSMACGTSLTSNFSVRLRRKENFDPGYYTFAIAGDDGIRFSLDGGATWILSSWYDQVYANSIKTTATAFPSGICLSGPVDLVVEFFQHGIDARLTFTATQVSPSITQPLPQTACEGANAVFQFGNADPGNRYQWQLSTDGGNTFSNLADGGAYSGVTTTRLTVSNAVATLNGTLYRCQLTNACLSQVSSDTAGLHVISGTSISLQPAMQTVCPGQQAQFSVAATGAIAYQWQVNAGTGYVNATLPGFAGDQTAVLTIANPTANMAGWQVRCLVTGTMPCAGQITSQVAALQLLNSVEITEQPQDVVLCNGEGGNLGVSSSLSTAVYRWEQSLDNGTTWAAVPNASPYYGADSALLTIIQLPEGQDHVQFRAVVSADCGADAVSQAATVSRCCVITALPNVITSNGDGRNDLFGKYSCALQSFDLKIYNRWGHLVYKSTDAAAGWNGGQVPPGMYFYQVSYAYQNQTTSSNGYVELVR